MGSFIRNLRYAQRKFWAARVFTATAVLTLALGIGGTTAIFTLIHAVMLRSLPVTDPDRLYRIGDGDACCVQGGPQDRWGMFSYPLLERLKAEAPEFDEVTGFQAAVSRMSVRRQDADVVPRPLRTQYVTGNYFSLLGVRAMRGRVLTPDDDKPSAQPAAVISHRYWEKELNSDSGIVGKNFIINGANFTIVGITPPEFFGERVRRPPDFWMPLSFQPQIELRESYLANNQYYFLMVMGRLKPGVSLDQAQAATNLALRQFLTEQAGSELTEERQKDIQNTYAALVEGKGGISGLRRAYSKPLQMLLAIVGMVLLIACANVGSLLLSRAAARKAEISLRLALGATRGRIVRQLLTESMLLAGLGGLCGVLLAQWAVIVLVGLVAREAPLNTRPDAGVLAFTIGVSIVAGLLFGLIPALQASRTNLSSAMKEKTRIRSGFLKFSLSSLMVVLQVGLSMVLLTGAGLFARSLVKLQSEDVGFDRSNLLLLGIDPRLAEYKPAQLATLYQQLIDRLGSLPQVKSVSMATYAPMSGTRRTSSVKVPGFTPQTSEELNVQDILAGPRYAETLGMPLLRGREIEIRDTAAAPQIAVVNETFAERYFKDQNPIGRSFTFDDETDKGAQIEIVGVVGDIKSDVDAREKPEATVYRPILQIQDGSAYSVTLHVRTLSDPTPLTSQVRQMINQIDPKLPIFGVTTMSDQLRQNLNQERLIAQLVSFFGALALILACIGLYGVMAHGVSRRTNEIGIRMALGARGGNIAWMVLRETLYLVLAGLAVGVPAAVLGARLISAQLFGMSPSDPMTLIAAAAVLTIVALLAGYLPARRASRVNPLNALRYE